MRGHWHGLSLEGRLTHVLLRINVVEIAVFLADLVESLVVALVSHSKTINYIKYNNFLLPLPPHIAAKTSSS